MRGSHSLTNAVFFLFGALSAGSPVAATMEKAKSD